LLEEIDFSDAVRSFAENLVTQEVL